MCGVSGAGSPAAPLVLCDGGESAGAGPSTVSCPCRALGRPIVPRFRYAGGEFAWRPISICRVRVEPSPGEPIVPCGWVSAGSSPDARLVLCAARSDAPFFL